MAVKQKERVYVCVYDNVMSLVVCVCLCVLVLYDNVMSLEVLVCVCASVV